MILRAFFWIIALGAIAVAQEAGEIAGRISDKSGAPLPGVRVTITTGDQSREAITDSDGRFVLRPLTMGKYRVVAELPGFTSTRGEISLSSSNPRAFLKWPIEPGCVEEDVQVILRPREAAPLADAILHIRITSSDGPVLISVRPECAGHVVREYSVQVLGSVPGRSRTSAKEGQVFTSTLGAGLEPGQEYLALLWPGWSASDELLLPIVSGLVTSPKAGELNGMRVDEALKALASWSQERKR